MCVRVYVWTYGIRLRQESIRMASLSLILEREIKPSSPVVLFMALHMPFT